jgi:hypothetical protein
VLSFREILQFIVLPLLVAPWVIFFFGYYLIWVASWFVNLPAPPPGIE